MGLMFCGYILVLNAPTQAAVQIHGNIPTYHLPTSRADYLGYSIKIADRKGVTAVSLRKAYSPTVYATRCVPDQRRSGWIENSNAILRRKTYYCCAWSGGRISPHHTINKCDIWGHRVPPNQTRKLYSTKLRLARLSSRLTRRAVGRTRK
jgi:hypothetical protein